MIEIRWHGRAGQGAKSASQLVAMAALEAGGSVQAFPEYGPERSGAPMRAFTRIDDRPIRRRYGVLRPDAVVVLDPSILGEGTVPEGVEPETLMLVNDERSAGEVRAELGIDCNVVAIPATAIAERAGSTYVNLVMAGALAGAIGTPPLDELLAAAAELLGGKLGHNALATIASGHEEALCPV